MIYATAMCFLAPGMLVVRNWNDETRGDICESLMGNYYELFHNKERRDCLGVLSHARDVSLIIERVSVLTYRLYKTKETDFHDSSKRIIDRAAQLRKHKLHVNVAARILPQQSQSLALEAPRKKLRLIEWLAAP